VEVSPPHRERSSVFRYSTEADKPDYLPAAAGGDSRGWLRGTHAKSPLRT
jgi:hypothetical protein